MFVQCVQWFLSGNAESAYVPSTLLDVVQGRNCVLSQVRNCTTIQYTIHTDTLPFCAERPWSTFLVACWPKGSRPMLHWLQNLDLASGLKSSELSTVRPILQYPTLTWFGHFSLPFDSEAPISCCKPTKHLQRIIVSFFLWSIKSHVCCLCKSWTFQVCYSSLISPDYIWLQYIQYSSIFSVIFWV